MRFHPMICLSFYLLTCLFAATTPRTSLVTPPPQESATSSMVANYTGSLDEVMFQFLTCLKLPYAVFQKNTASVPGKNHAKTGVATIMSLVQNYSLFVMQRRYEDYDGRPPVCKSDSLMKEQEFNVRLDRMYQVQQETGIVPLIERFVQQDGDRQFYIELYPVVLGQGGDICIKSLIGKVDSAKALQRIVKLMGIQTGHMFANSEPHPDCHPANFLVTPDQQVVAIDCRGPIKIVDHKKGEIPPALLFLQMFSKIIQQKLKENIGSTDCGQLTAVYQNTFSKCREAFIAGMESGLQGKEFLYNDASIVLSPNEIINRTRYLETTVFSDVADSDKTSFKKFCPQFSLNISDL